jgi:hypothetical protein
VKFTTTVVHRKALGHRIDALQGRERDLNLEFRSDRQAPVAIVPKQISDNDSYLRSSGEFLHCH